MWFRSWTGRASARWWLNSNRWASSKVREGRPISTIELVLAATDGSEHGAAAVTTGAAVAGRAGANFEVLSVVDALILPRAYTPPGVKPARYEGTFVREARQTAGAQASDAGATDPKVTVRGGAAAPVISSLAKERAADLIVVGAHPQRALARFLVGSTAERVIHLAHRPVLVAVEQRREPFARILVALDLSGQSKIVLRTAAAISQADGAELRALYIKEPLPPMLREAAAFDEAEYRRHGQTQLHRILDEVSVPSDVRLEARIREGRAGHEILEEAQDWDAELVVLGTHGFGFIERLLLGSTSTHVLRHGHRATIVVPPEEP